MRDQVYSRGQLLWLWLQAEYSFADVTRRQDCVVCEAWA